MSFRVRGTLDNTLYEVEVTGDAKEPVVGSQRVKTLVKQYAGDTVLVTPVGPAYKVSPGDPASILALLTSHTNVKSVGDGAPRLVEPPQVGTIR